MRFNWFSPLAPAATDIAHYTSRVLPALSSVAEVTLWTTGKRWPQSLARLAEVRRYGLDRLPWTELNRADMTFYHLGNNPRFHLPIWHVSRVHPGVVVLHDFRLHHFFDGVYRLHYQNRAMYLELMDHYYGEAALADATECFTSGGGNIDYMARRYPLTEFGTENALGVLVHTQESFEALRSKAECPLALAALPYAAPTRRSVSRRLAGPPFRLILFGYLGRNRRLESVFQALAGLPEKDHFRLHVFGSVLNDEARIHSRIRDLKLSRVVTLHGFVPEAKLDDALVSAHLAINLRLPTMGEASGSQLRIWSHALPSLVSRLGWYETLPGDAVALVRTDENEVGDIQNHLRSLLQSPEAFVRMGQRGLEELERNHSPAEYARTLVELAERAKRFRPRVAARSLARRAVGSITDWIGPGDDDDKSLRRVVSEALSLVKG